MEALYFEALVWRLGNSNFTGKKVHFEYTAYRTGAYIEGGMEVRKNQITQ